MRLRQDSPTATTVLVEKSPDGNRSMCKLYRMVPFAMGEVQYERDARTWTVDTGLRFMHAKEMMKYYEERLAAKGLTIPAGTYSVDSRSLRTSDDRIVIETASGEQIIIKLK